MFLGYLLGLYFSSCVCQFSTYFKYSKVLEYIVSLFMIESNKPHP